MYFVLIALVIGIYPVLSTFPLIHSPIWEITAVAIAAVIVAVAWLLDRRAKISQKSAPHS
jgi:heme A synthase